MNILYPAKITFNKSDKRYVVKFSRGEHSIAKLARTLHSSWPAISRLENPRHWPSLRQLKRVASAMGQRLVLSLEAISKV